MADSSGRSHTTRRSSRMGWRYSMSLSWMMICAWCRISSSSVCAMAQPVSVVSMLMLPPKALPI